MSAHAINKGVFPDTSNGKNTDFFFIQQEDPEQAVDTIVKLVKERLSNAYKRPTSDIQVLTPMQRGVVGAARYTGPYTHAERGSGGHQPEYGVTDCLEPRAGVI